MKSLFVAGLIVASFAACAFAGQTAQIQDNCTQLTKSVAADLAAKKITQDDADKLNTRIQQVSDEAAHELDPTKGMLKGMWQTVNRIKTDLAALESGKGADKGDFSDLPDRTSH